jgi:hypothetical protein
MKKYFILAGLIIVSLFAFSQQQYKYIIIPVQFSEIGEDLNPYGVSTALQKVLNEKTLAHAFHAPDMDEEYCDALTVNLVPVKSMFKNILKVELKDCRNQVIWSREGTGRSKEFRKGYAEAIADALSELDDIPVNNNASFPIVAAAEVPVEKPAVLQQTPTTPATTSSNVNQSAKGLYRPTNLFYNYTYFIDLVDAENGKKTLTLLNGELLGYENLALIGTLTPSGLGDVFTLEWKKANGEIVRGVANVTAQELKISLPEGEELNVITLQKY